MQPDMAKLATVLKKVDQVRDEIKRYCVGAPGPALSVMDLHYVVQQMYGLRIDMIEVDFAAVHFQGKVERYSDKHARIIVRASLSEREKRLVTVKEICHLIIDEEEDWSIHGTDTIDDLLGEVLQVSQNGTGNQSPTSALHSELMAMIAAGELMYPAEYRPSDMQDLADKKSTLSAIAVQHDMPAYAIAHMHKHHALLESARQQHAIAA
ncbi:hypothetical protein SAQ01S_18170 [Sphingomonas aquatilis NBRC 16722]|nr:hypothetical protein SAQ01S_18170 [Sphingomonas aquatilis NBRC 16722]